MSIPTRQCIVGEIASQPQWSKTSDGPSCFIGKDADGLFALQGWRIGRRQLQFSFDDDGLEHRLHLERASVALGPRSRARRGDAAEHSAGGPGGSAG